MTVASAHSIERTVHKTNDRKNESPGAATPGSRLLRPLLQE